ncbi:MAG: hypothetical protein ACR9NN_01025 [Nostochopsis sp.]
MNTAILELNILVANYPIEYIFALSGSFQTLVQKIAIAHDELQLRLDYMDALGKLFA